MLGRQIRTIVWVLVGGGVFLPVAPVHATDRRPNIILVLADDFGYECVTANGGESYQTPHLDRLAASGVRFEHCHVQPMCTPTRVELLTGLYNVRNYEKFSMMPRTETTIAHWLKQTGYATAVCGKWQLGTEKDSPQHFGFDEALLWQHTEILPRYANPGLELNGERQRYPEGSYGPKIINDFAIDFVRRHRNERFFLYYPMMLTHAPFQPTPDSKDWDPRAMGERVNADVKHFADMTAYMDKLIGELDATLDDLGIRDNTLLLFLGDNGTLDKVTSRFRGGDYQGGKSTTTASGTHVPLIVSWPAVIPRGRVNRDLIGAVDILPTFCEAAGARLPAPTDGVSFLPQLRGEKGTPREWLYLWYAPGRADNRTLSECAFDHRYKLYRDGGFFDLTADPREKRPLPVGSLTSSAATSAEKLRGVLGQFQNARPYRLGQPGKPAGEPAK